MSELRAIIFDFDGVIADTEPLHFAALREVLANIDIVLTETEYYRDYLGFDDRGCFTTALRRHGRPITPEVVASLMEQKALAYLTAVRQGLAIFPGVRELVQEGADDRAAAPSSAAIAAGRCPETLIPPSVYRSLTSPAVLARATSSPRS